MLGGVCLELEFVDSPVASVSDDESVIDIVADAVSTPLDEKFD